MFIFIILFFKIICYNLGSIILMGKKKGDLQKKFTFDNVFGPDSKQLDLYNICARKIVDSVLEGYNGR